MSVIQKKDSGTWGECVWVITDDNYLVIGKGTGAECSAEDVPWQQYNEDICGIIFRGEVDLPKGFSLKNFFAGYSKLEKIDMRDLNTAGVVSMQSMFADCEKLQFADLSGRDTSSVISMSRMFHDCKSLRYVGMSGIDTSNVTGMSQMFAGCSSLEEVDLTGADTSNVANMLGMFMNCGSLKKIELSGFDTSSVTDMSMMFSNCTGIEELDLSGFDTENVQDMSSMFLFCRNLKRLYLGDMNTEKVKDMSNMFAHCKALRSLDLESFDTRSADDISGMFSGCDNLQYGKLGPNFVFEGSDTGWPQTGADAGAEATACLAASEFCAEGAEFIVQYDPNGGHDPENGADAVHTCLAGKKTMTIDNRFEPAEGRVFKEWNTRRNGSGRGYKPSEPTEPIFGDKKLYAIWAGRPILADVQPLDEIPYGQKLEFRDPEINSNFSDINNIEIQMSRDGENDWETIDRNTVFPVSCSGSYLRYKVSNRVGETVSDKQEVKIRKADYDLSRVYWKMPENRKYDGSEKKVELANLPDTIIPSYFGNAATDAGTYTASATFDYDAANYNQPPGAADYVWEIEKSDIDVTDVRWNYSEAFTYDGSEKTVELTRIPEGAAINYIESKASVAGTFKATAELLYDKKNFNSPAGIEPLEWEIKCGEYDMSRVCWSSVTNFEYDGGDKSVVLENIPEDVFVSYSGNTASEAGDYIAVASFTPKNALNMNAPSSMVCKWSISKADYDMSAVSWNYSQPIEYDGTVQEIKLLSVPEGLKYELFGNVGINVGKYEAIAVFKPVDTENCNTPERISFPWEIIKADYDMGRVRWNYDKQFVYNGETRRVSLVNLPDSITAEYENNEAVACGDYTATVKLNNENSNYNDTSFADCSWQIVKADCRMKSVLWDYSQAHVFDGSEKAVRLEGLPENVSVKYTGNTGVDAGEYEATAEFTVSDPDNFNVPDPRSLPWQIAKGELDMSGVTWNYDEELVYDGTPKGIVLSGLPEEADVSYEENMKTDVGRYNAKATFTVDDMGNYVAPSPMIQEWTIEKADFDLSRAAWNVGENIVYDGNVHTVKINGLPENLVPVYTDNTGVNAATYIASVDFEYDEKNYNEPHIADCRWEISRALYDPGDVAWNYSESFIYDGTVKAIKVSGLRDDAEVYYVDCEATCAGVYNGEAVITAKDKGNFIDPEVMKCEWEIRKASVDMSNVRWSYDEPLIYNGMQRQIMLTGIPDGVLVKYDGNEETAAGKYIAKARFAAKDRNNFSTPDSMECEWEIRKADMDMSDVRWSCTAPLTFNGQIQEVTLQNLPPGLAASYTGNAGTDTGAYEAIAELELKDKKNFNLPAVKNFAWEIQKADFNMSRVIWDYNGPLTYSGNEQTVTVSNLPEGLAAVYDGNKATDVGSYEATVSFVPHDALNFNAPMPRKLKWEICKADIDMSEVKWSFTPGAFVYDGSLKTVLLENVPQGMKVKYNGNMETKAGDYIAEALIELSDDDNFNVPVVHSCIWKIEKADHDLSAIRWTYEGGFVYDGKKKSVSIIDLPKGVSAVYTENEKTDAGQYTAKAEFLVDKSNYNVPDPVTLDWEIGKAKTEVIGATWSDERDFVYDGREKSVRLECLDKSLKVMYKNNTAADAGEYFAEASVVNNDTGNYSETTVDGCYWNIAKADINMSRVKWDYSKSFMYDGSDKKVELIGLPAEVKPVYADNIAVNAGEYTAAAAFEVDSANYNTPNSMECKWIIRKAPVDISGIQWDYPGEFVYDGKAKTVALAQTNASKGIFGWKKAAGRPAEYIGLPQGTTVTYEANSAIEPGNYTAKATIKPADGENYILETVASCSWSIVKNDNGGEE